MMGDGECFGELSLFDFNKIKVDQKKKLSKDFFERSQDSNSIEIVPDVKRRGGTCTAVEETYALKIDHVTARAILQPDNRRSENVSSFEKYASNSVMSIHS